MIKGRKAQRVLVDKSYASKENHADLRGKLRGDILHKWCAVDHHAHRKSALAS
jgi:hypothetical protein